MDNSFLDLSGEHKHDSSVKSVGIAIEGAFVFEKLNDWLSTLLQEKGKDIFRSKGILSVLNTDDKFVFQGVHMLCNMASSSELGMKLPPWEQGEARVSKFCFIGRNLNREELLAGLQEVKAVHQ